MAVYPTPTGQPSGLPAPYSGPAINQGSSIAEVEAYLNYEGKNGAAYATWAKAAIAKDPALTPYNAAVAWLGGTTLAGGLGAAASGTGTAVNQIAQGAIKGADSLPSVPNPLSALAPIGNFFGALTQGATWIRLAKVVFGGALLVIGIAHITGASNSVATAARKVPVPI